MFVEYTYVGVRNDKKMIFFAILKLIHNFTADIKHNMSIYTPFYETVNLTYFGHIVRCGLFPSIRFGYSKEEHPIH